MLPIPGKKEIVKVTAKYGITSFNNKTKILPFWWDFFSINKLQHPSNEGSSTINGSFFTKYCVLTKVYIYPLKLHVFLIALNPLEIKEFNICV